MGDKLSGAVKAPAARGVFDSARALALGLGLFLAGGILSLTGLAAQPLFAILGLVALVLGAAVLVAGVYQFADNVDRGMKSLIDRR